MTHNCLHVLTAWTPAGRSEEEIRKIKEFSSFTTNPPTRDPRTEKQIEAYRLKERGRAKWLANYRQWQRYRETIGDPVPKSFETFMKHKNAIKDKETGKYKPDEKFKKWMKLYREANNP